MKKQFLVSLLSATVALLATASLSHADDREKTTLDKFPKGVKESLEDQTAGCHDIEYYRLKEDGKTLYETIFTTGGGNRWDLVEEEDGHIVRKRHVSGPGNTGSATPAEPRREKVDLDNIPKEARRSLKKHAEGSKDVSYFKTTDEGKDAYGAEYTTPSGRHMRLTVNEKGKVIDKDQLNAATEKDRKDDRDRDHK